MPTKQYINAFIPADTNGCGKWRGCFPISIMEAISHDTGVNIEVMQRPPFEARYYQGFTTVMYQRQISDNQRRIVEEALIPFSNAHHFWTVYNIDDCMHSDEIPFYNRGREAFLDPKIQTNIKSMLNKSDFVCVTTDELKSYYNRKYGVPLENIICIPNFLPRWWIGDYYDEDRAIANFTANRSKPRVGIISSLSHFNVNNTMWDKTHSVVHKTVDKTWVNERNEIVEETDISRVPDDFDLILDMVKESVDDFQWVLFGYCPAELAGLVEANKVEYHPGTHIMAYPSAVNNLRLNALIAPLVDIEFNRCKSNIKLLEAAALGIPLFAQNLCTYNKYTDSVFNTASDLYDKLMKLKGPNGAGIFKNMITKNYKFINSPHSECGIPARNWWMEDNINQWIKLFKLRPKGINVSFSSYLNSRKQFLYNKNGLEIRK